MLVISVDILIDCPIERVFAYVSNYAHDAEWRAGIIEMVQTPSEPARVGTKTREVARFFGQKRVTPAEVVEYEPGRTVAFSGLMANHILVSGSRKVKQVGDLTCFTYQAKVELSGLYRLVEPITAALLRRRFAGDLRRLKKHLE